MLNSWDSIVNRGDTETLANILEYNSIREHEEAEEESNKLKALMSIIAGKPL